MNGLLVGLAFVASANALVTRSQSCCFSLNVPGQGAVGQLSDGQNRVGGSLPQGSYCMAKGALTDGKGRGCILTPPTTQFQCDEGAAPSGGFSIDCNGGLSVNGSSTFYQCPTGSGGQNNIYTTPPAGQGNCTKIQLTASDCLPQCTTSAPPAPPPTSSHVQPPPSSAPPAPPAPPAPSCPVCPSQAQPATISVTVTAQAPTVTVASQAPPAPPAPPVTVTAQAPTVTVASQAPPAPPAPPVTVTAQAPTVTLASQAPPVTVTNQASPITVTNQASPMTVTNQATPVTVTNQATPVTVTNQCAPVTVTAQALPPLTVTNQCTPVTVTNQATPVTVTNQETPVTVTSQGPTVTQPVTVVSQAPPSTTAVTVATTLPPYPIQASNTTQAPPAPPTTTQAPPATTQAPPPSASYPHLIVPVDSKSPNTAYGNSLSGKISPTVDSLYLFDIPASYAGQTCSLIFLLPKHTDLSTSSYTMNGSGIVDIDQLAQNINGNTTWSSKGSSQHLGTITVAPGGSYTVATFPCAAGQQVSYQISSSGGMSLQYFQDYNPAPIGLYVQVCP